jgi:hypothetical protein
MFPEFVILSLKILVLGLGIHNTQEYKSAVRERTAQPSRQKRSWLPFLGRIARTISGLATEEDVATLHCHIDKYEHLKSEVLTDQMHILETVHSLYQTQDKRLNILNQMLQGFDYNMTLIISGRSLQNNILFISHRCITVRNSPKLPSTSQPGNGRTQ